MKNAKWDVQPVQRTSRNSKKGRKFYGDLVHRLRRICAIFALIKKKLVWIKSDQVGLFQVRLGPTDRICDLTNQVRIRSGPKQSGPNDTSDREY